MGKYAFIDRIFGDTDDEETEANDAFDEEEEDDDESGEESDEEDDDQPADEVDATLAQLDKDFRRLRARVRGSSDLSELRSIRADQSAAMAGPQTPTFRLRTRDIIEEIDVRVTDVRASRGPRGS
jgi:hypothetical protein